MNLFQTGAFVLSSGDLTGYKVECDALTDEDIATLATLAAPLVEPFGGVFGVPRGGLRLAEALAPYATQGPLLIVDDVLTTGASMERCRNRAAKDKGLVLFARGPCPDWVHAVWTLNPALR